MRVPEIDETLATVTVNAPAMGEAGVSSTSVPLVRPCCTLLLTSNWAATAGTPLMR